MRAIVLSLDRSASSISRKLAGNGWCDPRSQPVRAGRPACNDSLIFCSGDNLLRST
jgi:hypothetical protein